jgi:hypothetical protein
VRGGKHFLRRYHIVPRKSTDSDARVSPKRSIQRSLVRQLDYVAEEPEIIAAYALGIGRCQTNDERRNGGCVEDSTKHHRGSLIVSVAPSNSVF